MILITKVNETYIHIEPPNSLRAKLVAAFSFHVPGYQHMQLFLDGFWDGKIKLFKNKTGLIYSGLLPRVQMFAKKHDQEIRYTDINLEPNHIPTEEVIEFIKELNLPFKPYDYQIKAFIHAIKKNRAVYVSATASGKSLIIYLLCRWFGQKGKTVLIVVPTIGLVNQMASDFSEYYGSKYLVHTIQEGTEKNINVNYFKITLDNNLIIHLHGNKSIKMINRTMKMVKDIKEGDEIDDTWIRKNILIKQI